MRLSVSSPGMNIGRLVVRAPVTAEPETPIREAAALMQSANVSSMLVGGADAIVTERDLCRAWCDGFAGDEPVSALATAPPVCVAYSLPITEAAPLMLNRGVRHLVVLDGDARVGVVSLRTVLAVLLQAAEPRLWLTELQVSLSEAPESWLG